MWDDSKQLSREKIVEAKLKESLISIRKGCETDHTVEDFSWGLLANKCEVKNDAFGLVIELKPWAVSHQAQSDKETLEHRGKDFSYEMVAKRMMIQAIEHLLSVYEGRRKDFLADMRCPEMALTENEKS